MQQAEDFMAESRALANILEPLTEAEFATPTLFKGWTIDDVIGHLHMFNVAAEKTLESDVAFEEFFAPISAGLSAGRSLVETQYPWLDGLQGRALFAAWQQTFERMAAGYGKADPKLRVKWAGPNMSARSSITARQMETWAHGQEVFDVLGLERVNTDRVRNIAHLGVSTFGWTFINRQLPVPAPAPYVCLEAPSGVVWYCNMPQGDNTITGLAEDFAKVVTQVRNVADTNLRVTGPVAINWLGMAQCFAGPPQDPPASGSRYARNG
jgi:uncharacterized protein (TIGR03084 family)